MERLILDLPEDFTYFEQGSHGLDLSFFGAAYGFCCSVVGNVLGNRNEHVYKRVSVQGSIDSSRGAHNSAGPRHTGGNGHYQVGRWR